MAIAVPFESDAAELLGPEPLPVPAQVALGSQAAKVPWHAGVVRRVPLVPQATATTIPLEDQHNQLRLTRVA